MIFSRNERTMKICQFTTVHPRNDVRVFYKTCVALAEAEHEVILVVADGQGNEMKKGVQIIDIGAYRENRLSRYLKARKIMFREIIKLDADVYEFHDPELLSLGVKLKKLGRKVVFDSHEDVPKQILYKSWLGPLFIRKIIAKIYNWNEKSQVRKLDGLISVIEEITDKFTCNNKITIRNFPTIETWRENAHNIDEREDWIVYVGSLTVERGVLDYIKAIEKLPENYRLKLIGSFNPDSLLEECQQLKGWNRVDYLGYLQSSEVTKIVGRAKIGLSVLHPMENYLTSLPTKGFEYMASGTPFIMSDFPYWRPYFKGSGLFVTPADSNLLASTMKSLLEDEKQYLKLHNSCVKNAGMYSWKTESKKLIGFIEGL